MWLKGKLKEALSISSDEGPEVKRTASLEEQAPRHAKLEAPFEYQLHIERWQQHEHKEHWT